MPLRRDAGPESESGLVPASRPGWRGDEHRLQLQAAGEVGLSLDDTALDFLTQGFKNGMTLEDPKDGSVVLRGRTILRKQELTRALLPAYRYLGIKADGARVRVFDGQFEIRVAQRVAENSPAAYGNAKLALQLWIGFGMLGLTAHMMLPGMKFVAGIVWGIGLLLGAAQLRRGIAGGRAVLGARFALALALLAHEEQLVLPPAGDGAP